MSLKVIRLILGPLENNTYLVGDTDNKSAIVIDPSFQHPIILQQIKKEGWDLQGIWLTHGHFDHFAGACPIAAAYKPHLPIGIHMDDMDLWERGGEGIEIGLTVDTSIKPVEFWKHKQTLKVGDFLFEVRHTPGHTPGHVTFYSVEIQTAFCGDVIFHRSIGRTDLEGGDYKTLMESIRMQLFSLPPGTRLLGGHGQETNVADEMELNPFINFTD